VLITKTIEQIALNGGEEFILAKDEKQAESIRVSAFNARRKMPEELVSDVGIQKHREDGKYFVRIFKRGLTEAEYWRRDPNSGKLVPAKEESPELTRIISLMREDGRSEEEIQEVVDSF
jgi:hypothetical protein